MPHTNEVIGFGRGWIYWVRAGVVERETGGVCVCVWGGGFVFWLSSFNVCKYQGCITCKTCRKFTLEPQDCQLPFRFHYGRMHTELAPSHALSAQSVKFYSAEGKLFHLHEYLMAWDVWWLILKWKNHGNALTVRLLTFTARNFLNQCKMLQKSQNWKKNYLKFDLSLLKI